MLRAHASRRENPQKRPTKSIFRLWLLALPLALVGWALADGSESKCTTPEQEIKSYLAYKNVVDKTAGMVGDPALQALAARHGLQVLNLTWEDTGRYQNSSVGPNISDMTIQIQQKDPRDGKYRLSCMPVIRFPNFTDKTADIDANKFYLLVGNEKGEKLKKISLMHYLGNLRKHMTRPDSWQGDKTYLHADRDTHVLVSAQAAFLPVPKNAEAVFNPVLFNYQSMKGDPAVLSILVTPEGTSTTVIDNTRDGFQTQGVWGQRLFFNQNGQRASLTGKRLSDHVAGHGPVNPSGPKVEAAGQTGLNMVLLIQVPLRQKRPMTFGGDCGPFPCAPGIKMAVMEKGSDVEEAVIGHGQVEGPFTEIDNLNIERDDRFPVRVTVQFYKATSNGVVSADDMAEIAGQIAKVYKQGDYVGSLVVDGAQGRPTEYDGPKVQPPDWWQKFWKRHFDNTGQTRADALAQLRKLNGPHFTPLTESDLAEFAEKLAHPEAEQPELMGSSFVPGYGLPGLAGFAILAGLTLGTVYLRRKSRRVSL